MTPKKMVFVDDDPDDREMIQDGLEALNIHDFLVLKDSYSFYKYLNDSSGNLLPDAVVLDINMPGVTGLDILKHLKTSEGYQQIQVFIFTCASKPSLQQLCLKEGAAAFYTKPDSIEELNNVLNEIYHAIHT